MTACYPHHERHPADTTTCHRIRAIGFYSVEALSSPEHGRGAAERIGPLDLPDESPELAKLAKLPRLITQ